MSSWDVSSLVGTSLFTAELVPLEKELSPGVLLEQCGASSGQDAGLGFDAELGTDLGQRAWRWVLLAVPRALQKT